MGGRCRMCSVVPSGSFACRTTATKGRTRANCGGARVISWRSPRGIILEPVAGVARLKPCAPTNEHRTGERSMRTLPRGCCPECAEQSEQMPALVPTSDEFPLTQTQSGACNARARYASEGRRETWIDRKPFMKRRALLQIRVLLFRAAKAKGENDGPSPTGGDILPKSKHGNCGRKLQGRHRRSTKRVGSSIQGSGALNYLRSGQLLLPAWRFRAGAM